MSGPSATAAIVGGAIIEHALERLIVSKLDKTGPELLGQLFQNRGPLADFYSKLLIAEAFGIIGPRFAAELNSIRAVRNTFAHSKTLVTFDTPEVAKEVNALRSVSAVKGVLGFIPNVDNQGWFGLIVIMFYHTLDALQTRSMDAYIEEIRNSKLAL
jgi:DNA-binding MltR family transcriptional regulator